MGRDLKKTIIVYDIPRVFKLQKDNGISIKPFYGDVVDDRNTLKLLGIILEKIRFDAEENDGDIQILYESSILYETRKQLQAKDTRAKLRKHLEKKY